MGKRYQSKVWVAQRPILAGTQPKVFILYGNDDRESVLMIFSWAEDGSNGPRNYAQPDEAGKSREQQGYGSGSEVGA